VRFVGEKPGVGDDYERNILDRPALNRLYQALDVCVVSSRWEGGPYSVLEAILSGRPVISTPVGIARDLLPASSLFETPEQAAALLESHARQGTLASPDRGQVLARHSLDALRVGLADAFRNLPEGSASLVASLISTLNAGLARLKPPAWTGRRQSVAEMETLLRGARADSCFYLSEKPDRNALAASARGIQAALER
jgi:hypothetical protein